MATRFSLRQRSLPLAEVPASSPIPLKPSVSDAELVRRALDGDAWAEEAIYRRYVALVLGTSRRLLADNSDAEDVAQEAALVVIGALPGFRGECSVQRFATRTTVLVAMNARRKRVASKRGGKQAAVETELDELTAGSDGPEQRLAQARAAGAG